MSAIAELPEVLPDRNSDVEVAAFDTEFVVFDPRNRMAHRLEGQHALVFDACDGSTRTAALLAELHEAGAGDVDEVRAMLTERLAELADLGLLVGTDAPPPPPCLGCGGARTEPRRRRRFGRR
jgi:hypothetical protein